MCTSCACGCLSIVPVAMCTSCACGCLYILCLWLTVYCVCGYVHIRCLWLTVHRVPVAMCTYRACDYMYILRPSIQVLMFVHHMPLDVSTSCTYCYVYILLSGALCTFCARGCLSSCACGYVYTHVPVAMCILMCLWLCVYSCACGYVYILCM